MNKQAKFKKGVLVGRGIEWCDYTWNPIAGCFHACQWSMPDGSIANCYAEDVADRVAQKAYPQGFEFDYWHPEILDEPINQKTPSKIFVGSMADVFGHWVDAQHIEQVLDVCAAAPQHTFQFLTKNPRRVTDFINWIPKNVWIGASTPPDFMWNKPLSATQRGRWLAVALGVLSTLREAGLTTWLSAEPLTIDVGEFVKALFYETNKRPIDWMVIGAASNGRILYAPEHSLVVNAVHHNDQFGIATFFKGNLKSLDWARDNWHEDFPTIEPVTESLF